jgi:hypothetical protein
MRQLPNTSVFTDDKGHYEIDHLPVGQATVQISTSRYEIVQLPIYVAAMTQFNVVLRPLRQVTLSGVVDVEILGTTSLNFTATLQRDD